MVHMYSSAALERRRQRATDRGYLRPRVVERGFALLRAPVTLIARARQIVKSLALHDTFDIQNGFHSHYARNATRCARISEVDRRRAFCAHQLANKAKHGGYRPLLVASLNALTDPLMLMDPWRDAKPLPPSASTCSSHADPWHSYFANRVSDAHARRQLQVAATSIAASEQQDFEQRTNPAALSDVFAREVLARLARLELLLLKGLSTSAAAEQQGIKLQNGLSANAAAEQQDIELQKDFSTSAAAELQGLKLQNGLFTFAAVEQQDFELQSGLSTSTAAEQLSIDLQHVISTNAAAELQGIKLQNGLSIDAAAEQQDSKAAADLLLPPEIANEKLFTALVPGTAATSEGVCRSLLHAWLPGASGIAGADAEALDYLLEFVLDPQWSLAPLSKGTDSSAILSHLSRCVASGEEMLSIASKFVLHHCAPGCSASECRVFGAQVSAGMARGRQQLQHVCNVAEAAALSELPNLPKAPPKASSVRLKAVSKRR